MHGPSESLLQGFCMLSNRQEYRIPEVSIRLHHASLVWTPRVSLMAHPFNKCRIFSSKRFTVSTWAIRIRSFRCFKSNRLITLNGRVSGGVNGGFSLEKSISPLFDNNAHIPLPLVLNSTARSPTFLVNNAPPFVEKLAPAIAPLTSRFPFPAVTLPIVTPVPRPAQPTLDRAALLQSILVADIGRHVQLQVGDSGQQASKTQSGLMFAYARNPKHDARRTPRVALRFLLMRAHKRGFM